MREREAGRQAGEGADSVGYRDRKWGGDGGTGLEPKDFWKTLWKGRWKRPNDGVNTKSVSQLS